MMTQSFFDLSPEDTAAKRPITVMYPRRGRWRQLDGTLEHQIWYRWEHLTQENQVSLDNSLALLNVAMILTEEVNAGTGQDNPEFISLAVVWSPIQSRLKDGLYSFDKSGQAQVGQSRFPTTLYLASVSSHLPQSVSQVDAETGRQQPLGLVQSEGDTAP